jgi:hypothetical protein
MSRAQKLDLERRAKLLAKVRKGWDGNIAASKKSDRSGR